MTFGLLSAAPAGPVRDGNYAGQLQCSAVIGNPSNAGWSSPVELQVAGDTVLWQRGNGQFSESAQVRWSRGGFEIDALGAWSPASRKQGAGVPWARCDWRATQSPVPCGRFPRPGIRYSGSAA